MTMKQLRRDVPKTQMCDHPFAALLKVCLCEGCEAWRREEYAWYQKRARRQAKEAGRG